MKEKNYNFCCTEYYLIKNNKKKFFFIKKNYIDYNFLLSNRPIALSTVMITKRLIQSVSNKYTQNDFAEDYLWWIQILKNNNKCYILKKNLTNIYITSNSRSENIINNFSKLIFKLYGLKN